jgi:protein-disulfide isomerase-like protein with CxxC motif
MNDSLADSAAWRALQDDEADAFVASADATVAEADRAKFAASRCFQALVNRYGDDEARAAFKAALKARKMTKGEAMNLMMRAMQKALKEKGAPNPTAFVRDLFSGDGPFGEGRKPASVVRRLRPSRQTKKAKTKSSTDKEG